MRSMVVVRLAKKGRSFSLAIYNGHRRCIQADMTELGVGRFEFGIHSIRIVEFGTVIRMRFQVGKDT